MRLVLASLLFAATSLTLTGCASSGATKAAPAAAMSSTKSLYDRLGGKDAITLVVDEMLVRIGGDARINARFANADMPKLRGHLVDQICEATGGPCKYTGKDMKTAHTGMQVSGDEFGALVEDLKAALDKYKVGQTEQNIRQALQIAEAMAPSILFVDELEKGLSGVNGSGDSGVSTRLFGSLLTWLVRADG